MDARVQDTATQDMEPEEPGLPQRARDEGRRFARRMYLPRTFGLALGAICIGGGLWAQGASPIVWVAMLVNTLAWPHLAYRLANRSRNAYRSELRNLMVDSASGGVWIAMLGFNLAPSGVLVSMLAMDKVGVGGIPLLVRCLAAQAVAILVTGVAIAATVGFEFRFDSSTPVILASLPLLLVYPIAVGITAHRLAREVRRQNVTLAALSSTDGLTGLLNRIHWETAVSAEFSRCRRIGHQSSVMMLDIDHFKSINDTHGHLAGDEAIRKVAKILRESLRTHDVAARYGGEEFGVVLPGTDAAGARIIGERIRQRVANTMLDARHGIRATISVGAASFSPDDDAYLAWIARADRALYQAKTGGRNQVVTGEAAG